MNVEQGLRHVHRIKMELRAKLPGWASQIHLKVLTFNLSMVKNRFFHFIFTYEAIFGDAAMFKNHKANSIKQI